MADSAQVSLVANTPKLLVAAGTNESGGSAGTVADTVFGEQIMLAVTAGGPVSLGGPNVTTSNGLPVASSNGIVRVPLAQQEELWAVSSVTATVAILATS